MYIEKGWYKHKDFILLDLICVYLAFLAAYLIYHGTLEDMYKKSVYRNTICFLLLIDMFIIVVFEFFKGVLRRGYYLEFCAVIKQMVLIELSSGLYLFSVDKERVFSRAVLYLMGFLYLFFAY